MSYQAPVTLARTANDRPVGRVLPDTSKPAAPTVEQLLAIIDNLRAQVSAPRSTFSMKVSEKGCLSVYGLNTRGIHLYASQWERILQNADKITAFISANPSLARKPAAD